MPAATLVVAPVAVGLPGLALGEPLMMGRHRTLDRWWEAWWPWVVAASLGGAVVMGMWSVRLVRREAIRCETIIRQAEGLGLLRYRGVVGAGTRAVWVLPDGCEVVLESVDERIAEERE